MKFPSFLIQKKLKALASLNPYITNSQVTEREEELRFICYSYTQTSYRSVPFTRGYICILSRDKYFKQKKKWCL